MKLSNVLLSCLAVAVVHVEGQKDQFANNLKNCVETPPELDACLVKILEDVRTLMPVGIPELNLKPTEPFQINNLRFKTRPGLGISVDSTFTDVSNLIMVFRIVVIPIIRIESTIQLLIRTLLFLKVNFQILFATRIKICFPYCVTLTRYFA